MTSYHWNCACCGEEFDTLPICWSVGPPAPYQALSDEDRATRAVINGDTCLIDDQFYIRGHIEIPIVETGEMFVWSVWASLSPESTAAVTDSWDDDARADTGPFFGWLCSDLPYDRPTLSLKTMVHNRRPGVVPLIEVEPTDHPLAIEQAGGVTLARVAEIARMYVRHGPLHS